MKENSTEEDIKLLEEFSNENVLYGSMVGMTLEKYKDLQLSTEHILSDYKRVLKENEELNLKYYMLYTGKIENLKAQEVKIKSQVIPVQKVKDKIEEVQKEYNKLDKQVDEYINDANKDLSKYYENKEKIGTMQTLAWVIDNLQELLEGRK